MSKTWWEVGVVAKLSFFSVENGDMTLIELESGKKILIDVMIRAAADDPEDETPNVGEALRERLNVDANGRHYVDAFLLSHPDQDHCLGLQNHFYLGPAGEYPQRSEKIFVREIWSSPMVFRRKRKVEPLCEDAEAFNSEARRRVNLFRQTGGVVGDGDRIQILGEDEDGKTDGLESILVRIDQEVISISGQIDGTFAARLLGPLPKSNDESVEESLAKNRSSTILRFTISADGQPTAGKYLTGGDAGVEVWERIWERNQHRVNWLDYNVLLAPHHCSWRTLSHDSWSDLGEDAEVSNDARSALDKALNEAIIVASCKQITDEDSDPPCVRAKQEYEDIVDDVDGDFLCVTEELGNDETVFEIEISSRGPRRNDGPSGPIGPVSIIRSGDAPKQTDKRGGGRYA